MSIRVMNWVWENSSATGTELLLLLAIADAADDRGRNAYPSVNTLARKTRLSPRMVQRLLAKLETGGHISIRSTKGGRHSNSYTILLDQRPAQENAPEPAAAHTTDEEGKAASNDAQKLRHMSQEHISPSTTPDDMTPRQSVTGVIAVTPLGCHSYDTPGVTQLCHPTPPIPVLDPSTSSSRQAGPGGIGGGGGKPQTAEPIERSGPDLAKVLEALRSNWNLGDRSVARITKSVSQALQQGWKPAELIARLSANREGVKSPYAVLKARLEDLPAPPPRPPERAPWCGHCDDPSTRLVELDNDHVAPCPACHPKAKVA